jgi:hypothetical protein
MFRILRLANADERIDRARLKVLWQEVKKSNGRMSSPMWEELRALEKKFKEKPAYSQCQNGTSLRPNDFLVLRQGE